METNQLFEWVSDGTEVLALVIRAGASQSRYNFPTPPENALQVGVSFYKAGDAAPPHAHHPRSSVIQETQELVVVQRGRAEVDFYRTDGTALGTRALAEGEAVLFLRGGHGMRFLDDCRVLELKQGPYLSREEDRYDLPGARAK